MFPFSYGWNDFFRSAFESLNDPELRPGRVIGEEKGHYRIQLDDDVIALGQVSGKWIREANGRESFPAVGDWIAVRAAGDTEWLQIAHLLPRRNAVVRKRAGEGVDVQIMAANLDHLFIATSMNEDLNLNRLDRYLTLARNAPVSPVVLLTKADLSSDPASVIAEIEARQPGVPVHAISSTQTESLRTLTPYLGAGQTVALVGSSGVGKSTLVNALLGQARMRTLATREGDDKGRHTTTGRHLLRLPSGALMIDTPGLRELQLMDDDGLQAQFSDIEDLAATCRFGDCVHETEPGCAIRAALASGELAADRWDSFLKLQREIRHLQRKADKGVMAEDKKSWKNRTQNMRQRLKDKGRK